MKALFVIVAQFVTQPLIDEMWEEIEAVDEEWAVDEEAVDVDEEAEEGEAV